MDETKRLDRGTPQAEAYPMASGEAGGTPLASPLRIRRWADPGLDAKYDRLPQPYRMIDKIILKMIDAAKERCDGKANSKEIIVEDLNPAYSIKKNGSMGQLTAVASSASGAVKFLSNESGCLYVLSCKNTKLGHTVVCSVEVEAAAAPDEGAASQEGGGAAKSAPNAIVGLSVAQGEAFLNSVAAKALQLQRKAEIKKKKRRGSVTALTKDPPVVFNAGITYVAAAGRTWVKVLAVREESPLCVVIAEVRLEAGDGGDDAPPAVTVVGADLSPDARFLAVRTSDGAVQVYELFSRFDAATVASLTTTLSTRPTRTAKSAADGAEGLRVGIGSSLVKTVPLSRIPEDQTPTLLARANEVVRLPGAAEPARVAFACTPADGAAGPGGEPRLVTTALVAWRVGTTTIAKYFLPGRDKIEAKTKADADDAKDGDAEGGAAATLGLKTQEWVLPSPVRAATLDTSSFLMLAVGLESGIVALFNTSLGVETDSFVCFADAVVDVAFQGADCAYLIATSRRRALTFELARTPVPARLSPCAELAALEEFPVDIKSVVCFSDVPLGVCLCEGKQLVVIDLASARSAGRILYDAPPGVKTPGAPGRSALPPVVEAGASAQRGGSATAKGSISLCGTHCVLTTLDGGSCFQVFGLGDMLCSFYPSLAAVCKTRQQRLVHAAGMLTRLPHAQRQSPDAYKSFSFLPFHVAVPEEGTMQLNSALGGDFKGSSMSAGAPITKLTAGALQQHTQQYRGGEVGGPNAPQQQMIAPQDKASSLVTSMSAVNAAQSLVKRVSMFQDPDRVVKMQFAKQRMSQEQRLKRMRDNMEAMHRRFGGAS